MRIGLFVTTLVVAVASSSGWCESRAEEDSPSREIGLRIGEQAPEFALRDQSGRTRKFVDFRGKGIVALLFYRSADW